MDLIRSMDWCPENPHVARLIYGVADEESGFHILLLL